MRFVYNILWQQNTNIGASVDQTPDVDITQVTPGERVNHFTPYYRQIYKQTTVLFMTVLLREISRECIVKEQARPGVGIDFIT